MSARILVVDDILPNVKLLEAKLMSEYYSVLTAYNGFEAIEVARAEQPDLILLDVMMPKMDGFEACKRLKSDPATAHIPVVMVTALDQPTDRVRGLEVGADDFLTKPANDLALFARVRSLVRVKMMIDELRLRDETCRELGFDSGFATITDDMLKGEVLMIDDRPNASRAMAETIKANLNVECSTVDNRDDALDHVRRAPPELILINSSLESYDGLRLCSEIRSHPNARQSAIVMMVDHGDFKTISASLDLGANDYVMRPIDENELIARIRSQLRRLSYADRLRDNVHNSLKLAVTDSLTGLYNRRYAMPHLHALIERGAVDGNSLAVALLDIDNFKAVNDTYGHAVGDEVLVEFANRIRMNLRGMDMTARIGGEEFLGIMPETDLPGAAIVAERLRATIAAKPFKITHPDKDALDITVSIGVALMSPTLMTPDALLQSADEALYKSKREGRNRVTMTEPSVAA
jgi:two-component system cell cycle response regulator